VGSVFFDPKDNLDMTTEMGLDSNNAEVELRYRIVNKLKSGKPGSQLKFTINHMFF
jgi:hypothetical protein